MASNKKHLSIAAVAAAVILVTAAALLAVYLSGRQTLRLTDDDTGRVYLELPLRDGDRFSLTFVHSVHLTPVTDVFELRDGELYVVETRFYSFGAGMQTDYPEGVTYSYAEDGAIVLSGYDLLRTDMVFSVSKVADHYLEFGGEAYSLPELCGRGTLLRLSLR